MSDLVRGSAPPLPRIRKDVVRVNTTESQTFICLSRACWGQDVHWFGRRTHECVKAKKIECEGCKRGWPYKWKGYLHVRGLGARWDGFLELTDTAWRLLEEQSPDQKNLRGIKFQIGRTKGGAKGRYIINVMEGVIPCEQLPEEKDPYPTLKFLWSCKRSSGPDSNE